MRVVMLLLGVAALVLGLHWIGQGTGTFIWPSNPVMDNHVEWAYYGIAAALAGLGLIWRSRRRGT